MSLLSKQKLTKPMLSKVEAQKRADQVKAFQDELALLESDGVLSLENYFY